MSKKVTNGIEKGKELLLNLGLNEKAAGAYLALLRLGSATVSEIAKEAGLNRTNVYNIIANLMQRGLTTELIEYKKKTYQATDPTFLKQVLHENAKQLELYLPNLLNLYTHAPRKPEVTFYKGRQGFFVLSDRSLEKAHSASSGQAKDEILFLGAIDYLHQVTTEEYEYDYYIPKRIKKGLRVRMLTTEHRWAKEVRQKDAKELRETRFLPPEYKFVSSMYIYADEVSLFSSAEEMIGILIESKEINQMMRVFFEMAWALSK